MSQHGGVKNVVLVHGAFVDASGWLSVYRILKKQGYAVTMVQNPTVSLAGDVAATKWALAVQDGPAILVGHSYGGAVITEAGNDPHVAGLVYVAALAPDKGESPLTLTKDLPPALVPPLVTRDGFITIDKAGFHQHFAQDVNGDVVAFMADAQVPWGLEAAGSAITAPAWKTKPSWFLITAEDGMIPPDAQRAMSKRAGSTVVEVKRSHSVFLSDPEAVTSIIQQAAKGVALATA